MQLPRKYLLIGIITLVLVVVGLTKFTGNTEANSAQKTGAPKVAVAIVKREPVTNTYSIAGEFLPYQEVELHAKVAGYIRKINVDIGDHVKTGQVLAVLEVPELNAQVQGAEAGVRHSQDEITRSRNEVTRAEADHAALHAACERLEQAAKARPGLIAEQELDNAEAKDRASEAQVEGSKSALAAAEQQLDVSKASHSQVSAMQDYSRIVAPFSGVVIWRYADTGSLIQAGTSNVASMPVVKLAQVDVLRLRIPVPETLVNSIRIGAPADIHVQATGEHFQGKVARFTGSFDRSTRSMQLEIDVPNPEYKLSPGMYADVVLQTENRPDALTVPVQALSRDNDKTTVLLVNAQNRIEPREIRTGLEEPDRVEVVAGLKAGDRVVIGNRSGYQAGQVVDPKPSVMANATADGKENE